VAMWVSGVSMSVRMSCLLSNDLASLSLVRSLD
jgi:hypothetical protein